MATCRYRLTMNHIDTKHGIHKLERDGFTKEQIFKTMYKETQGASKDERTKIIASLYDRKE